MFLSSQRGQSLKKCILSCIVKLRSVFLSFFPQMFVLFVFLYTCAPIYVPVINIYYILKLFKSDESIAVYCSACSAREVIISAHDWRILVTSNWLNRSGFRLCRQTIGWSLGQVGFRTYTHAYDPSDKLCKNAMITGQLMASLSNEKFQLTFIFLSC